MPEGGDTIGNLEWHTITLAHHNTCCRNVHESYYDITRKVKVDVASFDGKIDATTFSDWLVAMENYFDWYEMFDVERVQFAKMKLVGPARKFWQTTHESP